MTNCFLSVFFKACREGLIGLVRALIKGDASAIYKIDEEGLAPIHHATRYDHVEIVELLIAGGAGEEDVV